MINFWLWNIKLKVGFVLISCSIIVLPIDIVICLLSFYPSICACSGCFSSGRVLATVTSVPLSHDWSAWSTVYPLHLFFSTTGARATVLPTTWTTSSDHCCQPLGPDSNIVLVDVRLIPSRPTRAKNHNLHHHRPRGVHGRDPVRQCARRVASRRHGEYLRGDLVGHDERKFIRRESSSTTSTTD